MLIALYKVEDNEELSNSLNVLAYDKDGVLYHLMYIILPALIKIITGSTANVVQLKDFEQLVKLLSSSAESWYFTLNTNLILRQRLLERAIDSTPYKVSYSAMQPYEEVMFKDWSFLSSVDAPFWVEYNISRGAFPYSFTLKYSGLYRDPSAKVFAVPNSIIPISLDLNDYLLDKELKKIVYQTIKKEHQNN